MGEINEVLCTQKTFINKCPIPSFKEGLVTIPGKERSKLDVDDAAAFLAHFKNMETICK